MRLTFSRILLLMLFVYLPVSSVAFASVATQATAHDHATAAGGETSDPDIPYSEFNHHVAGYGLIAVSLMIIVSYRAPKFRGARLIWPFLLIALGLFLAAWSDSEIWPRGPLSWTWLIHHDSEARLHKITAVLLVIMGTIEYLRAKQRLSRFWQIWGFPVLAVFGAVLLLFHAHAGTSGLPPGWNAKGQLPTSSSNDPVEASSVHNEMQMGHSEMQMDHHAAHSDQGMPADPPQSKSKAEDAIKMNHSGGGEHAGHNSPAALHIKKQHLWFTIVGISVALFKFIADLGLGQRFLRYLWPGAMAILGILLTMYTE